MQLKSILNRVQRHQSFTYGTSRLLKQATRLVIEIEIKARKGSKPLCSKCGSPGPAMIHCPFDDLSSCRSGGSLSSFSMPCGG